MAKCKICGNSTTFMAMHYFLLDSAGNRTKSEICQNCNAKLIQNRQRVQYDAASDSIKIFDAANNLVNSLPKDEVTANTNDENKPKAVTHLENIAKACDNADKKSEIRKAKKAVFIKYYPLMTLMFLLSFPIANYCQKNGILYLSYIYTFVFVFFASFACSRMLIAGGSKGSGIRKYWWVPATVFIIAFSWFTWVGPDLSVGGDYGRAEKTFDSWVNTDPNTWNDAQKKYFNNVMNFERD